MVERIQFCKGVLSLAITLPRRPTSSERKRSIELDFGKGRTIAELHCGEFVNLLYAVYPERAHEVRNLIVELLGAQTRIRRINFDLFYGPYEGLERSRSPDVQVELTGRAVERAGGQEDVSLSFC